MIALPIRPVPIYRKQADFLAVREKIAGFVGGRGCGKTWIGAYRVQRDAKSGDPWMAISPDAGVVHETTFPTFVEVAKETGCFVKSVGSPYPRVWWRTHDGGVADIVFRSAEVPKKLRGPSKAGIWIDEASVVAEEAFTVALATLRHKGHMGPCLMTLTPKGRAHWTFPAFYHEVDERMIGTDGCSADGIEWIQGRPYRFQKNSRLIHARTSDNPFLPPEFYEVVSGRYSSTLAAQELEGNFIDIAGIMFRREWFMFVERAPRDARRIRYWDRASTPGGGDYSAGVLVAVDDRGLIYIEDVIRGQWSYHDRNTVMIQTAERDFKKYGGEVIIFTEQEGGSSGSEVSQQVVRMLAGHPVFIDIVSGQASRKIDGQKLPGEAKVIRALPLAGQCEAGNVRVVRGQWNADFLDEMCAFPESVNDDQVDGATGAYNKLTKGAFTFSGAAERTKVEAQPERFGAGLALQKIRDRRARR